MSDMRRINREAAEALFARFAPMFVERERIRVLGREVWVATVAELLGMKRSTIAVYGADFQSSPRPQDFVDERILAGLLEEGANADGGGGSLLSRLGRMLGGR